MSALNSGAEYDARMRELMDGLKERSLTPRCVPPCDMPPAEAFIEALTGHALTAATFQTFDDRGKDKSLAHIFHGPLKTFAASLEKLNAQGAGIFLTINETDLQGRKKANVLSLRALFIDLDRPELPSFPFSPSIVVRSGRGWHVYWLLRAGEPLAAFEPAQKHLIRFYDSDPKVHDLPRVMRLPGFLWHKEEPARPIEIAESHPERIYSIDEILAAHPLECAAEPAPKPDSSRISETFVETTQTPEEGEDE